MDSNRRAFLRGAFLKRTFDEAPRRESSPALLPPWAADHFAALCTRCGACIEACPEQILTVGPGGRPVRIPSGGCTFCGRCAEVCEPGALDTEDAVRCPYVARIDTTCLARQGTACRLCEERCAPQAIRFHAGEEAVAVPSVDERCCTGCGMCVFVCPVQAIRIIDPRR